MAITMYSDVNEEGGPRQDLDELSAEGTAGPAAEVKRENWQAASPEPDFFDRSPKVKTRRRLVRKSEVKRENWQAASPERDFFDRSPKVKTGRRLVRKSFMPEGSPQVDDLEQDQNILPKRKSEVRKRRVQKVRDGRERMERDGRGSKRAKKAKVESSPSKLEKLARNSGGGNSERVAGADSFQRSKDGKREKSPWVDPDAAECSEEENELELTQDNDVLNDDSHPFEAEEGQEDDADQIDDDLRFFKSKMTVSNEGTSAEIALFVEKFLADLDVAAEADADLNRASKPAIEKLKLLPKLLNLLEKRQLQDEFLDRGILSSVKIWLEPLPDGSLPNLNIRSALLRLLTDLPIDVEVFERSEQLKKSELGQVVSFFSRLPEEIPANKKLARDLVSKWSRPIFQKSTRYEDLKQYNEERPLPSQLPVVKNSVPEPCLKDSRGRDEFELEPNLERKLKPGDPGYRYRASRPQALPLDFVIRPASKMNAENVRAQAKLKLKEEKRSNTNKQRSNINKKLQQLAKRNRGSLQAVRLSVHGK